MTELELTKHAEGRMGQRGIQTRDIDLAMLLATEVDDGFIVREKDCAEAVRVLKQLTQRVERLAGTRLVCEHGRLITAYQATVQKADRLLAAKQHRRRKRRRQTAGARRNDHFTFSDSGRATRSHWYHGRSLVEGA